MCGGHHSHSSSSPEGLLTRSIRTYGEIEPCRLDIKSSTPLRRYQAMKELVTCIDKLVYELKEKCPTLHGLYERSDAMLTIYPGDGSRFAKHIDNTTADGRKITVLCYLNPEWNDEMMGGALRLFIPKTFQQKKEEGEEEGEEGNTVGIGEGEGEGEMGMGKIEKEKEGQRLSAAPPPPPPPAPSSSDAEGGGGGGGSGGYHMKAVDVYPQGGRVAIFYSSEIAHEVLPTYGNRHALTIWYYDTNERKQTLERAKESGKGLAASKTSLETQQSAQRFISQLMSQCEGGAGGAGDDEKGLVTLTEAEEEKAQAELVKLQGIVKELSDDVIEIVSNITGAPSVDSFRDGFELLTTRDLRQMRGLFQRMGLGSYHLT
jgi:hypothetical protein